MTTSLQDCRALDAQDPLRPLREQFVLPDGVIYLDGNSLGVLPKTAAARVADAVTEQWGQGLIRSWNSAGWFDAPQRLGDKIAQLVGAAPGEVVATDSTSINLYKVLSAALNIAAQDSPGRQVVLSERSNFPTDLYIAEALCRQHDLRLQLVEPEDITGALSADVAVLMLTHVNYRTGAMHDMAALTRAAHQAGALTVWDLAHSAGAVPVDLHGAQADFAVGCGYKYLNGGPGAPAFAFVAERHHPALRQPLTGWHGHARPFEFSQAYEPAPGVDHLLVGTAPQLSLIALEAALSAFDGVDLGLLRRKSVSLTDLFIRLVDQELSAAWPAFGLATPREAGQRGSQVSLTHEQGYAIVQALIARGVIGDFRAPNMLRFGFAALYLSHVEVWDAVAALKDIMATGAWAAPEFMARKAVT